MRAPRLCGPALPQRKSDSRPRRKSPARVTAGHRVLSRVPGAAASNRWAASPRRPGLCGPRPAAGAGTRAGLFCRRCSWPTRRAPSERSARTDTVDPSTYQLLADRDLADIVLIDLIAKTGIVADLDGAARRGFHL